MAFLELAKKRYSTRKYSTQPVEKEKIDYILEAGRIAPSAANYQPWHFVVVQSQPIREQMWEVYRRPWFKDAPVYLILCADHRVSWKRSDGKDHADVDVAIAADHITLAAADVDLGTCWICNFDTAKCSQVLSLPDHIEPVVILSVGYPLDDVNTERHTSQRKPTPEVVRYEHF
ncbi:MAG: nitroreductase family protein [Bacteroidales bacterium]|nr:nitroreductase family protein [Bacteroidales bacterium]MDZ4205560.1 nitroreductase family protein [Bacteroidales bacterium]